VTCVRTGVWGVFTPTWEDLVTTCVAPPTTQIPNMVSVLLEARPRTDRISGFLVFGLLYHHTICNSITTEMHTSGVCSNKEARKRLTESNGTPAMDLGDMNVGLKENFFCVLLCDCCFK